MLVPKSFLMRAAGLNQAQKHGHCSAGALAISVMPIGWALSMMCSLHFVL